MKLKSIKISSSFLLVVLQSVLCISTLSNEWTDGRKPDKHQISKRQDSGSNSSDSNPDNTSPDNLKSQLWYKEQCIDHDGDCSKTSNQWSQRYWMSKEFYQPGGPIFMMIGGESTVSTWVGKGTWNSYAKFYNATTLVLEHRFYGQSFPTPKTNRSAEAMEMLTSRQALQDAAQMLTWFKTTQNKELKDAKVVSFGGSYPGFLSAWFRAKYPKLVNVAVSSSAPLNNSLEFPEYVNTVSTILQQEKPDCFNKIKSTFTCIQNIYNGTGCSQSNVTAENIGKELYYCDQLKTDTDKEFLYTHIGRSIWAHNAPGTSALLPKNNLNQSLCDILLKQNDTDVVKAYGKFLSDSNNNDQCNRRRKREARDPGSDLGGYTFSWNWQILNEFVNFQVADPVLRMLGTNWGKQREIKYYSSFFPDAGFDENKLNESVARTKESYPPDFWKNNATCTIFTYGSWDPWARKGITSSSQISDKNTVYFIPKGQHVDDLVRNPTNPYAKDSLLDTQNKVMKQIGTYLNNPDC